MQEQAEWRPALGWRQQPEPHPARENSPPAGSAKPRKSRRIKTNVLFCNIERVCVSVRVGVLCICLSVRKGTASVSPRTGHTERAVPSLTTNEGRRPSRRGATRLTQDLLFPNHWCLLSSLLSGTWTSEAGTLQRQLPRIFHRVGQTLLQVAKCTIFVMWGQVYSGWYVLYQKT